MEMEEFMFPCDQFGGVGQSSIGGKLIVGLDDI